MYNNLIIEYHHTGPFLASKLIVLFIKLFFKCIKLFFKCKGVCSLCRTRGKYYMAIMLRSYKLYYY